MDTGSASGGICKEAAVIFPESCPVPSPSPVNTSASTVEVVEIIDIEAAPADPSPRPAVWSIFNQRKGGFLSLSLLFEFA